MTASEFSRRRMLETIAVSCVAGCAAPTSAQRFEGFYSWGFEESVFEPCTGDDLWWVVDDHELVTRYQEVAENDYEQVYATVRGLLSESGSYGHGGEYSRQLEVTGVETVRAKQPDDC